MDKFEKLVRDIMNEALRDGEPVSKEEAEEMARYELNYKKNINTHVSTGPRKKKSGNKRVSKVSDEKINLFNTILANLDRCEGVERQNIEVLRENKLIRVKIGDKIFKVDIIQQRK